MRNRSFLPTLWVAITLVTFPPRAAIAEKTPSVVVLDDTLEPVARHFNERDGRVRFVALLSPTCSECILGAEAVKSELVDRFPANKLDVIIVWAPMLESDSEAAAKETARMFDNTAVAQFYDPNILAGKAYRHDVFPDAYDKGVASLPNDHWLHEMIPDWGGELGPEWDIYMFFDKKADWRETPPQPSRFVRHLGRIVEHGDEYLSLMWIDDYSNPPIEGNLYNEIRRLGDSMMKRKR